VGNPAYYGRFGFVSDPGLRYGSTPRKYVQRLSFTGAAPTGEVVYHPAFAAEPT
jgi:putative acetyltransferase